MNGNSTTARIFRDINVNTKKVPQNTLAKSLIANYGGCYIKNWKVQILTEVFDKLDNYIKDQILDNSTRENIFKFQIMGKALSAILLLIGRLHRDSVFGSDPNEKVKGAKKYYLKEIKAKYFGFPIDENWDLDTSIT